MWLTDWHAALVDLTRVRMLYLLTEGPLCVGHFQTILEAPQVKVSKHLGYLLRRGLVERLQFQNWRVYRLPETRSGIFEIQLRCLRESVRSLPGFAEDLERRASLADEIRGIVDRVVRAQPIPATLAPPPASPPPVPDAEPSPPSAWSTYGADGYID